MGYFQHTTDGQTSAPRNGKLSRGVERKLWNFRNTVQYSTVQTQQQHATQNWNSVEVLRCCVKVRATSALNHISLLRPTLCYCTPSYLSPTRTSLHRITAFRRRSSTQAQSARTPRSFEYQNRRHLLLKRNLSQQRP